MMPLLTLYLSPFIEAVTAWCASWGLGIWL